MADQTTSVPIQYDTSKYNTGGMMYPADLMSGTGEYGGNYVMFFINVHEDSELAKEGSGNTLVPNVPASKRDSMSGTNISKATEAVAPAIFAAGAANAGGVAQKAAGAVGVDLSGKGAAVANTALGVAGGAAMVMAIGGTRNEYKRQSKAICLYMPSDLSVKYGMVWDETSLAGTAAMMAGAENVGAAALKVGAGAAVGAGAGALLGGKKGAKIGGIVGGVVGAASAANNVGNLAEIGAAQGLKAPGIGEYMSKSSGTAANPKKEQLFKEVRFRDFSFNYQFFPRSSAEARSVLSIVKEFKLHMHPEFRDTNQFLYIYPSEFDIVYYTGGAVSPHLPKHTSAVLTDMSVMYSPQGVYTSFADGMPTQINITLSFRELALLTKKDIMAGY